MLADAVSLGQRFLAETKPPSQRELNPFRCADPLIATWSAIRLDTLRADAEDFQVCLCVGQIDWS